jgi:hypothetical protein
MVQDQPHQTRELLFLVTKPLLVSRPHLSPLLLCSRYALQYLRDTGIEPSKTSLFKIGAKTLKSLAWEHNKIREQTEGATYKTLSTKAHQWLGRTVNCAVMEEDLWNEILFCLSPKDYAASPHGTPNTKVELLASANNGIGTFVRLRNVSEGSVWGLSLGGGAFRSLNGKPNLTHCCSFALCLLFLH